MLKLNQKQQQEKQGFFSSQHLHEFTLINFIPSLPRRQKKYKPKPFFHNIKLQPLIKVNQYSLINNNFLSIVSQKMLKKYESRIMATNDKGNGLLTRGPIQFDSNFESGNLQYAVDQGNNEYHLFMKADSNTKGHFQWFYFKVTNQSTQIITIVIKNFVKKTIIYNSGLKPYFRSQKSKNMHYEQIEEKVSYYEDNQDGQVRYALKFVFKFTYLYDQVEFCSQPPYTYLQLQKFTISLPFKTIQISSTVMGNKIQAFVINQEKDYQAMVVVMARQHPGQSVGSWMMEGFLNCLKKIQNNIFWLIIPMVNIDGVIVGNNRTGLLGYDFNRNWNIDENPNRSTLIPEIRGILRYCKSFKRQSPKKIKMMIDLHGHSSQQNVFSYGPFYPKGTQFYKLSKLFPLMIHKRNRNFNLQKCIYEIKQDKKNSSRSVFFKKLGFHFSYTIQSSFGVYRQTAINQTHLLTIGRDICIETINFLNLITSKGNKQKVEVLMNQLNPELKDVPVINDNSDDSSQDQNQPMKRQFLQNAINIMANPHSYHQEKQKLKQQYNFADEREELRLSVQKQITLNRSMILQQKEKSLFSSIILSNEKKIKHIKTQQPMQGIHSKMRRAENRRFSIGLPSLFKDKSSLKQSISEDYLKHKNSDKSKLKEFGKLFNLKESTIGKQIIVINGFFNKPS